MTFKELVARITGLSIPIFGISWNPVEADVTIARRVLTFLEDRRVLRDEYLRSDAGPCAASVREVRTKLTQELADIAHSKLREDLKAMERACRAFLDALQANGVPEKMDYELSPEQRDVFQAALASLRRDFAYHITRIAAQHGLGLHDELAWMLEKLPVRKT
jgi:hypothetical protein